MGSVGRSPKGTAQPISQGTGNSEEIYSDVDTHTTPMSDEDIKQVSDDWHTAYFQTGNAFVINTALRKNAKEGVPIEETFRKKGKDEEDIQGSLKTIETMDKNMRPTNKEMKLLRLTDGSYIENILINADVSNKVIAAVDNIRFRGNLGSNQDEYLKELNSKLSGLRIQEHGYMSCTYNLSLSDAAFKSRHIALDITAPQGTRGMFSPTGHESEFVGARGSTYDITGVRFDNKLRKLVLEVRMNV